MGQTYYDTLGVNESASEDEVKSAFRKLAKEHHPDRNKGNKASEEKFKSISEAYDTLSDKRKREEYDTMRKYGAFSGRGAGGGGFPGGGPGGFDFSDMFRQGNSRRGGFQTFRSGGGMGGMNGFEDILSQFFGGGAGQQGDPFARQRQRRPRRGQSLTATLNISFLEMVNGTTRTLQINQTNKKLAVKIPPGIVSGGKIRLAGQGLVGPTGQNNGDLIITVHVMPDQNFERKGNDVHTSVSISFKDAILGSQIEVATLTKKVNLRIPAGTQPGTKMRLKGQGLAVGSTGDLYVTINIDIPTTITDEQRKILEEWG
ncbi:MAG: J domain-containing protein [candidate division Zixibacteria bacterium]|nr:J domain-containing protein [candidate division Zixibacteria bacterium]